MYYFLYILFVSCDSSPIPPRPQLTNGDTQKFQALTLNFHKGIYCTGNMFDSPKLGKDFGDSKKNKVIVSNLFYRSNLAPNILTRSMYTILKNKITTLSLPSAPRSVVVFQCIHSVFSFSFILPSCTNCNCSSLYYDKSCFYCYGATLHKYHTKTCKCKW